jgi:hypothetical protein
MLYLIVVNSEALKSSEWLLLLRRYSIVHGHSASNSLAHSQICDIEPCSNPAQRCSCPHSSTGAEKYKILFRPVNISVN